MPRDLLAELNLDEGGIDLFARYNIQPKPKTFTTAEIREKNTEVKNPFQDFVEYLSNDPFFTGVKRQAEKVGHEIARVGAGTASEIADYVPALQTKHRYAEHMLEEIARRDAENEANYNASMQESPWLTGAGQFAVQAPQDLLLFALGAKGVHGALSPVAKKLSPLLKKLGGAAPYLEEVGDILARILGAGAGGAISSLPAYQPEGIKGGMVAQDAAIAALVQTAVEGLGIGGKTIGKVYNTTKAHLSDKKALKELTETIKGGEQAKMSASERELAHERKAPTLLESLTTKPIDETKTKIATGVKTHKADLLKRYEQNYETPFTKAHGAKKPVNPITEKEIPKGSYSKDTKALIDDLLGSEKTTESAIINPSTGKPETTTVKKEGKQTVNDLVRLYRQARSEADSYWRDAKNKMLTAEQRAAAREKAQQMTKLKDVAYDKIVDATGQAGKKEFDTAQRFYHDYITPFDEKSFLSNALKSHPEIPNTDFLAKYGEKGLGKLKADALKQDYLKSALLEHELAGKEIRTLSQLDATMKSEIADLLPADLKQEALVHLNKWKTDKAFIEDITQQLTRDKYNAAEIKSRIGYLRNLLTKNKATIATHVALGWIL